MRKIKEIIIRGESGYCHVDDTYDDKLTIKSTGVKYVYKPTHESENNKKRKWSYTTISEEIENLFCEIADDVLKIIKREIKEGYTDLGVIEFQVTYDDNSKDMRLFFEPIDEFADTFRMIKKMVPPCEEIPEVLKTKEDYL